MRALTCTIDEAGADVGEELAMRPPDFLPAVDIGHEHPGAHNVLKVRTNLFKGFRDSADSFAGLLSYILATDSPAIRLSGGRAGYRHPLAHTHRTRVAHDGLPRCPR